MPAPDSDRGRRRNAQPWSKEDLSAEELNAERGGELPDREALSLLDANVAIPIDPAIAADVLEGADLMEAESEEPERGESPRKGGEPEEG